MADLLLATAGTPGVATDPRPDREPDLERDSGRRLADDLSGTQGWTLRVVAADGVVAACADRPADLVAVDLEGLGPAGLDVLVSVAERYPRAARVALTTRRDSPDTARASSLAHRVLTLPVPTEVLRAAVADVLRAHRMPSSTHLVAVVGGTRALPSAPATWLRLTACLADERAGATEAAEIVAADPGLTAKLLQVVNSAYFGLGRTVSSAREAVALLGCEAVRSLVLSFEAFAVDHAPIAGISPAAVRRHGLACAAIAQRLTGPGRAAEDAFTGALVQDVGLWVLAEGCRPELEANLDEAQRTRRPLHEIELERLGVTHAEVGAHLLGLWGLPHAVIDAVAGSHDPVEPLPPVLGPSDAVRIAHLVVQHDQPGAADPTEPPGAELPDVITSVLATLS